MLGDGVSSIDSLYGKHGLNSGSNTSSKMGEIIVSLSSDFWCPLNSTELLPHARLCAKYYILAHLIFTKIG